MVKKYADWRPKAKEGMGNKMLAKQMSNHRYSNPKKNTKNSKDKMLEYMKWSIKKSTRSMKSKKWFSAKAAAKPKPLQLKETWRRKSEHPAQKAFDNILHLEPGAEQTLDYPPGPDDYPNSNYETWTIESSGGSVSIEFITPLFWNQVIRNISFSVSNFTTHLSRAI